MGALVAALTLTGCYASHEAARDAGEVGGPDAGLSRFQGRWFVDQPTHATYEVTIYDLVADGRVVEVCSGGEPSRTPTGHVTREVDGLRCVFTGPWASIDARQLAIDCFGDDSVARTVVLGFTWSGDAPEEVRVVKVDGEETGWSHAPFEWRWLPCAAFPAECEDACL